MRLPTKSRYTVREAAFHIAIATGETVRSDHILDWGAQELFKLYIPMTSAQVRRGDEVYSLRGVQVEIRLTVDEAARLSKGDRIRVAVCWHDGQESQFVRRKPAEYGGGYALDALAFDAKSVVLRGEELDTFISSFQDKAAETTQIAQKTVASMPVKQQVKDWHQKVRELADELDARDLAAGAESSKEDMSKRIAFLAEQRGISGAHGKLTAGNILREALQGGKWVRKRTGETGKSGK